MVKLFGKLFPDKGKRKLQTLSAARLALPYITDIALHCMLLDLQCFVMVQSCLQILSISGILQAH